MSVEEGTRTQAEAPCTCAEPASGPEPAGAGAVPCGRLQQTVGNAALARAIGGGALMRQGPGTAIGPPPPPGTDQPNQSKDPSQDGPNVSEPPQKPGEWHPPMVLAEPNKSEMPPREKNASTLPKDGGPNSSQGPAPGPDLPIPPIPAADFCGPTKAKTATPEDMAGLIVERAPPPPARMMPLPFLRPKETRIEDFPSQLAGKPVAGNEPVERANAQGSQLFGLLGGVATGFSALEDEIARERKMGSEAEKQVAAMKASAARLTALIKAGGPVRASADKYVGAVNELTTSVSKVEGATKGIDAATEDLKTASAAAQEPGAEEDVKKKELEIEQVAPGRRDGAVLGDRGDQGLCSERPRRRSTRRRQRSRRSRTRSCWGR